MINEIIRNTLNRLLKNINKKVNWTIRKKAARSLVKKIKTSLTIKKNINIIICFFSKWKVNSIKANATGTTWPKKWPRISSSLKIPGIRLLVGWKPKKLNPVFYWTNPSMITKRITTNMIPKKYEINLEFWSIKYQQPKTKNK